ncbi:MAG TPA: hypothetical protein VNM72_03310 [Blastocatellia bacterium]|nr:hypothetical protein [Blastocatellia bacterium]
MNLWTPFTQSHRPLWVERAVLGTFLAVVPGGLLFLLWLAARRLKRSRAASQRDDSFTQ